MLRGRGRDSRTSIPGTPTLGLRSPTRAPIAKPEPDYEVVEFPSEQYVNAKLQPPPPPPPRPPTGHPTDTSCGLCGGGGARVRCSECGRRALCASCDDMYHRHPKRRNHQRQALPPSMLKDERPPLPPKGTPPVPPPRRHKVGGDRASASPKPPATLDQRRAPMNVMHGPQNHLSQVSTLPHINFSAQRTPITPHQMPSQVNAHLGSMPNFAGAIQNAQPVQDANARGGLAPWGRPRPSLPGYNIPPQNIPPHIEHWDAQENLHTQSWGRPLRRGASVMELGAPPACSGYNYPPNPWHYGSCANLEHTWGNQAPWSQSCCMPPGVANNAHMMPHSHAHVPYTPQPYRRAESRAVSRAASRANSRAPSPALSMRSRTSRRTKHRTPSPSVPSSDADSESEPESDKQKEKETDVNDLGPVPPPPNSTWQCEHCTFVNEPGVRVCTVCCRTPTVTPKIIPTDAIKNGISKLSVKESTILSSSVKKVEEGRRNTNDNKSNHTSKERVSTGCGPSPPKEVQKLNTNSLETHTHDRVKYNDDSRNHIAVGPSPPKEVQNNKSSIHLVQKNESASKQTRTHVIEKSPTMKQSIGVGSSPPRSSPNPTIRTSTHDDNVQKKSVGVSPPRENDIRSESRISRTSVSNTGTSPPPQSISTQTYEVPNQWEKQSLTARSRPRRRFTDENRRERSHSRHSLSSDTRESERSVRTGGGRWEWREPRDSSPGMADWSENERKRTTTRLTRRASHLDLRRNRASRRSSIYGSEAPSPEPFSNVRASSLEALAGSNSMREAERGLELARLMAEAERLGFSAAEVQAALAQNPVAPLAWLRERWPSLCAGVRAAAARLAAGINVSELEARAALARHRGAMWPAVTECVERHRRQHGDFGVGEEGKLRGRVWGSPIGADDEAIPPSLSTRSHRGRAEDSSDEYEVSTKNLEDDNWMYLPLDIKPKNNYVNDENHFNQTHIKSEEPGDIAEKLKLLLNLANEPSIEDTLIRVGALNKNIKDKSDSFSGQKDSILDFIQSEKDFIEAYNALTRLSPLPNIEVKKKDEHLENLSDTANLTQISSNNKHDRKTNFPPVSNPLPASTQHHLNVVKIDLPTENILSTTESPAFTNTKTTHIDPQEPKTNNLSDLVDNTQKIIKQMKDEINYDINSTQETEESETSSNNSDISADQESSYSETENDTEDITSDEKEDISSSNEEYEKTSAKDNSKDMTSSEDNEQFEEAMDYIDAPPENVNNVKILDSIAQTLRHDQYITLNENKSNPTKIENEDVNNNLFAVVNSFDEIYEQLNKNVSSSDLNTIQSFAENNHSISETKKFIKESFEITHINVVAPIKQIITEIKYPVYKAVAENIFEQKLLSPKSNFNSDDLVSANQKNTIRTNENDTDNNNIKNAVFIDNNNELNNENLLINKSEDTKDISESNDIDFNVDSNLVNDLQDENIIDSSNDNIPNDLSLNVSKSNDTKQHQIIKSNIPIPVKTNIKNNTVKKPNIDKLQKTASKLPVRRASIKQYPAPAPPKTQFSNIQNGNVRQLQTKLFNNKSNKELDEPTRSIEVTPSTSAIPNKKNPAPQPPQMKQMSPPKITSKEREQYFRETCRTEDEWTESESDEDIKLSRERKDTTPTPLYQSPPPLTMRRVSGQLIDLASIRLPEGSPERQARMLLAEGATENWEQAQMAVELIARGTDAPTALLAALECTDLTSALAYLNQYCELCAAHFPEHEMVSMLRCSHRCCRECARHYFTVQITERSIVDCVCAYCKEPELEILDEDAWVDYFANLDILLKTLVDIEVHELFQRKLRDRTLARDPNFRWCIECSSGFFVHPKQKKLKCPECKSITCASCRKPWTSNHDGISCEQYETWLEDNDPERSIAAVQQHLKENGLECPRCRFKYSLSRGGCMHFTCTQCKYEFCYGCGKPFMMGARCGLSEYCAKLGLHAHHPRNCLFYLRDKEPHELQTLLQMNNVNYEKESPQGATTRCPIQLQRETPTGLIDTTCGSEVLPKQGGLCKMHYVEYLAGLARHIDPIPIMEVSELVAELRRRALPLPERGPWDTDPIYAGMCAEIVKEKIPLD